MIITRWHRQAGKREMRVIALRTLREFWIRYADAEPALRAWYHDALRAQWQTPEIIRQRYANASILPNNRVVFNIKGNDYRLITAINYDYGVVYIRFVGSHTEYDKVDAVTI